MCASDRCHRRPGDGALRGGFVRCRDANITTGGDVLWWGFTTIIIVGYGDTFPVTTLGRITAVAVMLAASGSSARWASILASVQVSPRKTEEAEGPAPTRISRRRRALPKRAPTYPVAVELASSRVELAALRESMSPLRDAPVDGASQTS